MHATVVVIGAGHSGLAVSRRLTERSIDHVVLERGEVANSWRTERWDSLRLLTPNWLTRLPGKPYAGGQPDGFMSSREVAAFVDEYAGEIAAPVHTSTAVTRVGADAGGFVVSTDRDRWTCAAVVVSTGPCSVASVPASAATVPPSVCVHTAMSYRSPDRLPDGGVLVVGASATGVQLAEEIRRSGRPVTLAAGEHVRLPRTYRGRDIFWWTDAAGILDERHDEVDDLVRARHLPSPQLIGSPERRSLDLNALVEQGVAVVGRFAGVVDGVARFSGALANTCALADLKMDRLLDRLDEWASRTGADVGPPERFRPTEAGRPALEIDLALAGIGTVVFATGYRPDYPWLDLPVLDRRGRIAHDGGAVTAAPGCFVVGLNLLRRRRSSYINGADADSADIASMLHRHLDTAQKSHQSSANRAHVAGRVRDTDVVEIAMTPIGVVRNQRTGAVDDDWDRVDSRIELDPAVLGPDATRDLRSFSHVEVVFVFDRVNPDGVERNARHPRGNPSWPEVGILAQRAKDRPNRIGTTVCELMAVRPNGVVEVRGLDAIDGTPVLDIKPYIAEFAPRGDVVQPAWASELMTSYWRAGDDAHPTPDPEAWLTEVRRSPADHGRLELIVRRPEVSEREVLDVGELDVEKGLLGDNWLVRGSSSAKDGKADPEAQLNIMNMRCARLVAGVDERVPLAGDQLFVDLDLSPDNLPAGTRLRIGTAVIEVTAKPHTGCSKFTKRFGLAAHRWINGKVGRGERLRGICAKVVVPGTIRQGDEIVKLPA